MGYEEGLTGAIALKTPLKKALTAFHSTLPYVNFHIVSTLYVRQPRTQTNEISIYGSMEARDEKI